MARIALAPITSWITEAALAHDASQLPAVLMQRAGLRSRRSALALLRRLQAAQWLSDVGTRQRPRFVPGPLRQVVKRYALQGLQEDLPWRRDFAPCFELPAEVSRMLQHAFCELVNNAIAHSGGSGVTVSLRQTPLQAQLLVSDDGCGLFRHIADHFAIDCPRLAMFELGKGKLTSAPQRHAGHGLFFSARLADVFYVNANASAFQCLGWEPQRWRIGRPASRSGTSAYLAIALDTPRTLDAVLRAHSSRADYAFDCTRVPLNLLASAGVLDSRAEAQRASARLAGFARAELDFAGISDIGPGFADELFRVFPAQHPALNLVPLNLAPRLASALAPWLQAPC